MRKRKGFTLIELLVVISIITLLMAILMATLQRVRKQAKAVACQSKLRQWSLVFSMYDKDYEGRFCSGCNEQKTNDPRHWAMALRPYYYHDRQITLCPSATKPYDTVMKFGAPPLRVPPYAAWRGPDDVLFSYGLNGWVYNAKESDELRNRVSIKRCWGELNIKGAENIPLFLDCLHAEGRPFEHDEPPEIEGTMVAFNMSANMTRFCLNRHNGAVNCLFMDSSISKVGLKRLWLLKWHRNFNTNGPWTKAGGITAEDWPQWMRGLTDY